MSYINFVFFVRYCTFGIVRISEAIIFAFVGDIRHWLLALEIDDILLNHNDDNINIDNKFGIEFLQSDYFLRWKDLVVTSFLPFIVVAFSFVKIFSFRDNVDGHHDDL